MMICMPDCTSLWKEIEQRNVERDEMMNNIRVSEIIFILKEKKIQKIRRCSIVVNGKESKC